MAKIVHVPNFDKERQINNEENGLITELFVIYECFYLLQSVFWTLWSKVSKEPVLFIVMHCVPCEVEVEETFSLTKPFRLCTDVCQEWGTSPLHHQSGLF